MATRRNTGFYIDAPYPIDGRMRVNTASDLNAIPVKYDRMVTHVIDENKDYRYYANTNSWVLLNYSGNASWGNITGDINSQTDLINKFSNYSLVGHTHPQQPPLAHTHPTSDITDDGFGNVVWDRNLVAPDFILVGSNDSTEEVIDRTWILTDGTNTSDIASNTTVLFSGFSFDADNKIVTYDETDPTVPDYVKAISTTDISNWNNAYSGLTYKADKTYVDTQDDALDYRIDVLENPDRVIKYGEITFSGLNILIGVKEFEWVVGAIYTSDSPEVVLGELVMTVCDPGKYKFVLLQGNPNGTYSIREGLQSSTAAQIPTPDPGTIALVAIHLFESTILDYENVLSDIDEQLSLKEDKANKGVVNGYTPLDSNGKVPLVHMNDSLLGNVHWKGLYDGSIIVSSPDSALVGQPLPAPSSSNTGWYFIASTNFTYSGVDYKTGDWIISNGIIWDKVDNTDSVSSVFGRVGNITAQSGDYTASQITNVPSGNISALTVQDALNELDSEKAIDANVLHTIGNENFTGVKTATNTGSSQTNGLYFTNNGTGIFNASIRVNTTNTASGIYTQAAGTGAALKAYTSGAGNAIEASTINTGYAIAASTGVAGSTAIYTTGTSGGNSFLSFVDGTGNGIISNLGSTATGFNFIGQNNGSNTFTVNKLGNITGNSFIKSGATSTNLLLAGGGDIAQSTFAPASGGGNYIQNQNSSAQSANMWISGNGRFGNGIESFKVGGSQISLSNANNTVSIKSVEVGADSDMTFNTQSNTERMRITSNGNVGIGTTNPSTKLHVNGVVTGTTFIKSGATSTNLLLAGGGDIAQSTFALSNGSNATGTWGINISGNAGSATSWGSGNQIDNTYSSAINGAMIGFGSDLKWHYVDNTAVKSFLGLGSSAYTNTGAFIQNQNTSAQSANMWISGSIKSNSGVTIAKSDGSSSWTNYVNTDGSNRWYSNTLSNDVLALLNNGNVGIGTTNPLGKFHAVTTTETSPFIFENVGGVGLGALVLQLKNQIDGYNMINYSNRNGGTPVNWYSGIGSSGASKWGIFYNNLDTPSLVVKDNGFVGIGFSDPGEKLMVAGNGYFDNNLFTSRITLTNLTDFYNTGIIGNTRVRIGGSTDGRIMKLGPYHSASEIVFEVDGITGPQNKVGIYGVGHPSFSSGAFACEYPVLIGNTTDNGVDKLQVNGNARVNGKLDFNGALTSVDNGIINGQKAFRIEGLTEVSTGPYGSKISLQSFGSNGSAYVYREGLAINSNLTVTIPNLSGTGTRTVVADASGNLSTIAGTGRPYTSYTALLTQTGTNAPTAIVLENSIGSIVWTRSGQGQYVGTLSGAFPANKTAVFLTTGNKGTVITNGYSTTTSTVAVNTFSTADTSFRLDDAMDATSIEIRVYP